MSDVFPVVRVSGAHTPIKKTTAVTVETTVLPWDGLYHRGTADFAVKPRAAPNWLRERWGYGTAPW